MNTNWEARVTAKAEAATRLRARAVVAASTWREKVAASSTAKAMIDIDGRTSSRAESAAT